MRAEMKRGSRHLDELRDVFTPTFGRLRCDVKMVMLAMVVKSERREWRE